MPISHKRKNLSKNKKTLKRKSKNSTRSKKHRSVVRKMRGGGRIINDINELEINKNYDIRNNFDNYKYIGIKLKPIAPGTYGRQENTSQIGKIVDHHCFIYNDNLSTELCMQTTTIMDYITKKFIIEVEPKTKQDEINKLTTELQRRKDSLITELQKTVYQGRSEPSINKLKRIIDNLESELRKLENPI